MRMVIKLLTMMGGVAVPYYRRIIKLFGTNLKRYWQMAEASGTAAVDSSPSAANGTYTNVTLGQTGIGDGKTCALFDQANSNLFAGNNIMSGAAWDECTMGTYVKTTNTAISQAVFCLIDAVGWVQAIRVGFALNTANKFEIIHKITGNEKTGTVDFTSIGWNSIIVSISRLNDRMRLYVNGVNVKTLTGFGTWPVVNNAFYVGTQTPSTRPMVGNMAHGFLLDREITPAEAAQCFFP